MKKEKIILSGYCAAYTLNMAPCLSAYVTQAINIETIDLNMTACACLFIKWVKPITAILCPSRTQQTDITHLR